MINVSESFKNAFLRDMSLKAVRIIFYKDDGTLDFVIDNNKIRQNTLKITRKLMDGTNISVIGCISSVFEVDIEDVGDLSKRYCWVGISADGSDELSLGKFKIDSCKRSSDKRYRHIVAYDDIYWLEQIDVTDWYNEHAETDVKTLLFNLLDKCGIQYNHDMIITNANAKAYCGTLRTAKDLNARKLLRHICQINGVYGYMNYNGIFNIFSASIHDVVTDAYVIPYHKEFTYEDYSTAAINTLICRDSNNDEGYIIELGESVDPEKEWEEADIRQFIFNDDDSFYDFYKSNFTPYETLSHNTFNDPETTELIEEPENNLVVYDFNIVFNIEKRVIPATEETEAHNQFICTPIGVVRHYPIEKAIRFVMNATGVRVDSYTTEVLNLIQEVKQSLQREYGWAMYIGGVSVQNNEVGFPWHCDKEFISDCKHLLWVKGAYYFKPIIIRAQETLQLDENNYIKNLEVYADRVMWVFMLDNSALLHNKKVIVVCRTQGAMFEYNNEPFVTCESAYREGWCGLTNIIGDFGFIPHVNYASEATLSLGTSGQTIQAGNTIQYGRKFAMSPKMFFDRLDSVVDYLYSISFFYYSATYKLHHNISICKARIESDFISKGFDFDSKEFYCYADFYPYNNGSKITLFIVPTSKGIVQNPNGYIKVVNYSNVNCDLSLDHFNTNGSIMSMNYFNLDGNCNEYQYAIGISGTVDYAEPTIYYQLSAGVFGGSSELYSAHNFGIDNSYIDIESINGLSKQDSGVLPANDTDDIATLYPSWHTCTYYTVNPYYIDYGAIHTKLYRLGESLQQVQSESWNGWYEIKPRNQYIVQNNMFWYDQSEGRRNGILFRLYNEVQNVSITPFSGTSKFLPWIEPGDELIYNSPVDGAKRVRVMNMEISGVSASFMKCYAEGDEFQDLFMTDIGTRLDSLDSEIKQNEEEAASISTLSLNDISDSGVVKFESFEVSDDQTSVTISIPHEYGSRIVFASPYAFVNGTYSADVQTTVSVSTTEITLTKPSASFYEEGAVFSFLIAYI